MVPLGSNENQQVTLGTVKAEKDWEDIEAYRNRCYQFYTRGIDYYCLIMGFPKGLEDARQELCQEINTNHLFHIHISPF